MGAKNPHHLTGYCALQGVLFRNPISPDGVFGSMWDASTLGISGNVDSHSSESLGSVAVHGFLDSGRASLNPFSGADALLGSIGGPESACHSSLNASDADGVKADVGEEGVAGGGKLEEGEGRKAVNASKVQEGEAMKVEEEESGKGKEAEAMKVEEEVPASTVHEEEAAPDHADGDATSSVDRKVEGLDELHKVKKEEGDRGEGAGGGGGVENCAEAAGGDKGGGGASGEGAGGGEVS